MHWSSLKDVQFVGKRVLVRVDWNVPIDGAGKIVDDFKIQTSLPTLREIRRQKPYQILLVTHLGNPVIRPGESLDRTRTGNRTLQLGHLARHIQALLKISSDQIEEVSLPGSPLPGYQIAEELILLENLRFHPGELANDRKFASALAGLADIFVHEAFPEIHRSVASLVTVPQYLEHVAGRRLIDEVGHLHQIVTKQSKPNIMILGGAKVADKILVIDALIKKVDHFLLGGVMANTFLAATGVDLKDSAVEEERFEVAKQLFNRAPQKFILPIDFIWDRNKALDIGTQTQTLFARYLSKAALLFWNGPMGWTASGRERFFHGSEAIARGLAASTGTTIVAGGDTLAVIDRYKLGKDISLLSTGGGATLAYLAGEELPGLKIFEV